MLMNFELWTFPYREIIKLSIHIWHGSKMNPFIYRERKYFAENEDAKFSKNASDFGRIIKAANNMLIEYDQVGSSRLMYY